MQIFDCAGVSSFQIWFHQAAKQVSWLNANQGKKSLKYTSAYWHLGRNCPNTFSEGVLENGPLLLYLVLWDVFCIWKNSNSPPIRDSYYKWQMKQPECRHRLTSWLSLRQVGKSCWVFWKCQVFPNNSIGSPRRQRAGVVRRKAETWVMFVQKFPILVPSFSSILFLNFNSSLFPPQGHLCSFPSS